MVIVSYQYLAKCLYICAIAVCMCSPAHYSPLGQFAAILRFSYSKLNINKKKILEGKRLRSKNDVRCSFWIKILSCKRNWHERHLQTHSALGSPHHSGSRSSLVASGLWHAPIIYLHVYILLLRTIIVSEYVILQLNLFELNRGHLSYTSGAQCSLVAFNLHIRIQRLLKMLNSIQVSF